MVTSVYGQETLVITNWKRYKFNFNKINLRCSRSQYGSDNDPIVDNGVKTQIVWQSLSCGTRGEHTSEQWGIEQYSGAWMLRKQGAFANCCLPPQSSLFLLVIHIWDWIRCGNSSVFLSPLVLPLPSISTMFLPSKYASVTANLAVFLVFLSSVRLPHLLGTYPCLMTGCLYFSLSIFLSFLVDEFWIWVWWAQFCLFD